MHHLILDADSPASAGRALGVPERSPDSAEAADWFGRPDLVLVQGDVDEL